MKKRVYILFLIITLAECARINSRQNFAGSKKETRLKSKTRISQSRGEVIENLFNVYDPSFLAVAWPKITNGVHVFLDQGCWKDLSVFFKDLSEGRAWAYRAVDASGRYQSGLFQGSRFWLGSKEQCFRLDHKFVTREGNETLDEFRDEDYLNLVLRREKYFDGGSEEWRSLIQRDELMRRLVAADNAPPHRLGYTAVQLMLNLTKITMAQSYNITLGVCLPRSCSPEDIASVINFSIMMNDNFKSNKTLPRTVKVTSLREVHEYYDVTADVGAIILICVTLCLFTLTVAATIVDLKLIKCKRHRSKSMSFDLQKINNNTLENRRALDNDDRNHTCEAMARKEANVVDLETLTINNINNSNNINLVTVKKVIKPNAMPPSITLDVVSTERITGSCKRCGKYKKQCGANNQRLADNLPACPRVKSFASLTEHKNEKFFRALLLCFSLHYSWKRIFNTNMANKDLSIIHVLRIIATFWIIFVHVAMITSYVSENGGDINDRNGIYYIMATGTLAFDTLFFVSGAFSSHHFFYLKSRYTVEELVSVGGTCGRILQFVCFITNRAVRLLPSYAYVIFLSAVLARVYTRTSALALPERDDTNCDQYWWRNLLYITTVFPREEQCMQVSWYMSAESQLHVCGALACAAAGRGRGRRAAAALLAAALLLATAADLSAAYVQYSLYIPNVFAAYSTFIERPVARVTPYFMGVFTGWLVHRMGDRFIISKTKASCLWCGSLLALLASFSMPWLTRAWLSSWLHVVFPIALLWPVFVLSTVFADASRRVAAGRGVAALSRLAPAALLLHGPLARALLLPAHARALCTWSYFAGTAVLTVVTSLLLSLLVETPCCSLLRRLSDYAS